MELVRPSGSIKRPANGVSEVTDLAERALTMIQMHVAQCNERHDSIQKHFASIENKIDQNRKTNVKLTYIVMTLIAGTGGSTLVLNEHVLKLLGSLF